MSKRKADKIRKQKVRELRFKSGGEGNSKFYQKSHKSRLGHFSKNSPFNPINYSEQQIIDKGGVK